MKKSDSTQGPRALVRMRRSFIGRDQNVRATLRALGLRRIGDCQEHTLNPSIQGLLRRVRHVISVDPIQ